MHIPRTVARLVIVLLAFGTAGFGAGYRAGEYRVAKDLASHAEQLETLRRQLALLSVRGTAVSGTAGSTATLERAVAETSLVDAVAAQVRRDFGLLSPKLVRERRASFVELYATDASGATSYGTAGYLGDGYFMTVKHGVVRLGSTRRDPERRFERIKLRIGEHFVEAVLVDAGEANEEVDPGDWAIVRATAPVDLPALRLDLGYEYPFADPIVRLGNDYSKGIIASAGYVGQHAGGLVTCLTDGHPGVSGGGVLNQEGDLVGIPIGRMQGDYRFSFILPLRADMFRKVPGLLAAAES